MLPRVGSPLPSDYTPDEAEFVPGFRFVPDPYDDGPDPDGKAEGAWIVDAGNVVVAEVLLRRYGFGLSIRESAAIGVGAWASGRNLADTFAEFQAKKAA